jgi:hypothetical protein
LGCQKLHLEALLASGTVAVVDPISLVDSIPGWMQAGDAAKLYEAAYCANGPILEVGTYQGKSAVLMARALKDAGRPGPVYTLDVDKALIAKAERHARDHGVEGLIVFVRGTVAAFARAQPLLRPALTFVDGDHRRRWVESDLRVLATLVPSGGILLFHDFADPLNDEPGSGEVQVRPAVESSWVARECEFGGVFGSCGLFTRRTEPPASTVRLDLLALDGLEAQYLYRLRYPAGRVWKRLRGTHLVVPSPRPLPPDE